MHTAQMNFTPSAHTYQWTGQNTKELQDWLRFWHPGVELTVDEDGDELSIVKDDVVVLMAERDEHLVVFMNQVQVMSDDQVRRAMGWTS